MSKRNLRIYLEVCKQRSITKAANNLYLAQPAVSLVIKELEETYQTKLIHRSPKSFTITESGMKLMHYAIEILKVYEDIEQEFLSEKKKLINLGSSITIAEHFLPKYMKAYRSTKNPATLRVTIDSSDFIIKKILNRELDFALIDEYYMDNDVIVSPYFTDHFVAIASKNHLLAQKSEITFREFLQYDLLLREQGNGERELFDSILKEKGITKTPTWESRNAQVLISGVSENLGISILPLLVVRENLYTDNIQCINVSDVNFKREFYVIYHKDMHLSSDMNQFIKVASSLYLD